jgi:hypothetical protein
LINCVSLAVYHHDAALSLRLDDKGIEPSNCPGGRERMKFAIERLAFDAHSHLLFIGFPFI